MIKQKLSSSIQDVISGNGSIEQILICSKKMKHYVKTEFCFEDLS